MAPRLSRLERMTNLVLALLETERPLSLREIGAAVAGYPPEHGALRQAFERDKRTLRAGGTPSAVERLDGEDQVGYRIRPEDYYLPELGLTTEETEALSLALAAVRLDGARTDGLAAKLGGTDFDALPPIAHLPALPALGVLEDAIRHRARVGFTYRGRRRDVAGYGLVFTAGSWYFVGEDGLAEPPGVRTFRVDRLTDEPRVGPPGAYELPVGFDAEAELRRFPLDIGGGTETTEVVLLVSPRALPAARLVLGPGAERRTNPDGWVEMRTRVADERALVDWAVGLGPDVVVADPKPVRERVVAALEAIAAAGTERR